ncbi:MAG: hypothetical protein AB1665_01150 [Candidatus Thermoplasmatota archaeon]
MGFIVVIVYAGNAQPSGADPSALNLTTAERGLFEGLVRELDAHRAHLKGRAHAPHEVCAPHQAKIE